MNNQKPQNTNSTVKTTNQGNTSKKSRTIPSLESHVALLHKAMIDSPNSTIEMWAARWNEKPSTNA